MQHLNAKYNCHFDSCSHLTATDMSRKLEGCIPLGEEDMSPHLTSGQCQGITACQVSSWSV